MADYKISLPVPPIPETAIEFAKALGDLADKYCLQTIDASIRINTGADSIYEQRRDKGELIREEIKVFVSKRDGRGRPRTKITLSANMLVETAIVNEPDSWS